MWLEQGILMGLGVSYPQVRGRPVNSTGIIQGSDTPLLQRNKKLSIFNSNQLRVLACTANNIYVKNRLLCLLLRLQKISLKNKEDTQFQIRHVGPVIMKKVKRMYRKSPTMCYCCLVLEYL